MFKIIRLTRNNLTATLCCYSSKQEMSSSTKMPTQLTVQSDVTSKSELNQIKNADKDTRWRTPWHEKEGEYYSTLRTFYTEHNNTNLMKFIQAPINLSPSAIKAWWAKKQEERDIAFQQYLPARNNMLGNELAAAHFIVHRGGSVKFFGQNHWIKADQLNNYSLPDRFQDDFILQAIDCSDVNLYYEGLANFRDLKQLEWFSVNGCEKMDDWCMDRITHIFARSLLYLDIRDCPNITFRGVGAVAKMSKLKILYVDNIMFSNEFEMTCLLLQEAHPHLDIRTD